MEDLTFHLSSEEPLLILQISKKSLVAYEGSCFKLNNCKFAKQTVLFGGNQQTYGKISR